VTGIAVTTGNHGVRFKVRVSPRASRAEIAGAHGDALKVRVQAPPVGGAANGALIELLSRAFGVPKGSVRVVSGETSRTKTVEIDDIDAVRVLTMAAEAGSR